VLYLIVSLGYSHVLGCLAEPGYPEKIATATGENKLNL